MCHLAGIGGLIAWPICATPSQDGFMRLCVEVIFCHFIEEINLMPVLSNVLWVCNGVLLNNLNLFHISMVEWVYYVVRMVIANGLVLWCQGICYHHPHLFLYKWFLWLPESWHQLVYYVLLVLMVVWVGGYLKVWLSSLFGIFIHMRIVTVVTIWSNTT